MIILRRPQTDPYFNIAAEEYLLKSKEADYFMLWINEPAVIVGKHQNTLAEINFHFLRERQIPVIRRITGGGTVFHDPGNLNFSFIQKGERGKLVDFRKYIDPVIAFLRSLGMNASFEGKNNIRINDFKVSGNSEHVYKNKVLHHGTLLFSSELDRLKEAIRLPAGQFEDKGVKSIRTHVANIADFLAQKMSVEQFREKLIQYITSTFDDAVIEDFTKADIAAIQNLANKKYRSWDWNFGYSPAYAFRNSFVFENEKADLQLSVKNGKIIECSVTLKKPDPEFNRFMSHILKDRNHSYPEIKKLLNKYEDALNKWNLNPDILLHLLF